MAWLLDDVNRIREEPGGRPSLFSWQRGICRAASFTSSVQFRHGDFTTSSSPWTPTGLAGSVVRHCFARPVAGRRRR